MSSCAKKEPESPHKNKACPVWSADASLYVLCSHVNPAQIPDINCCICYKYSIHEQL